MEIGGGRRAGNGASSEDESHPQALSLWAGSRRSAAAYCRHSTLSRARRATSSWERRQLRGEGQGNSAPAEKRVAGPVFTVPAEARSLETGEAAAVEVKFSADTISGPLLGSPGRRRRVLRAAGLRGGAEGPGGRATGRPVAARPAAPLCSRSNSGWQFLEAG